MSAMSGETQAATPLPGPTVDQVLLLQVVCGYPAVSLLQNTTAAPRMTKADAAGLRALAGEAVHRLRRDPNLHSVPSLESAVERAVEDASTAPTSAAVAVFVSAAVAQHVSLPVRVRDRAVVDATFATRDLVRALHRTPRHVVLVFNSGQARLFDGGAGVLRPATTDVFPMRPDHSAKRAADPLSKTFLRRVDAALGVYLRLRPAPLILVGPDRVLTAFRSLSRNTGRLAGSISGNLAKAPLGELAQRLQPVLDLYLHSRQTEALQHLAQRDRAGRVVTGMPAAWLAARHERPEMLVVEEGLFYPARLSEDGDFLSPATDLDSPEVIDDAVDELIEFALQRGAWVALAEDGTLAEYDRVALTLRPQR